VALKNDKKALKSFFSTSISYKSLLGFDFPSKMTILKNVNVAINFEIFGKPY